MNTVDISRVSKVFRKLPKHIEERFFDWVQSVEEKGIRATRIVPGYHDEPLKGQRFGERSVRLSRSYRIIYTESKTCNIVVIVVLEVNKHEY